MHATVIGDCPSIVGTNKIFCGNTCIQRHEYPRTKIFETEKCGFGLCILENITKGTLIAEYRGEVITLDECKQRLRSMDDEAAFYYASLDGNLILDAGPMGSEARFANHSCRPNCSLHKWDVLGEPRVILMAEKDIEAGDELTYNYRADTLNGMVARQVCYCGAPNCSGFIGKG